MIGAVLRECLELVESFYAGADGLGEQGLLDGWRETELQDIRLRYISKRRDVRKLLNSFYDSVAQRMVKPTWDPQKIEKASWDRAFEVDAT